MIMDRYAIKLLTPAKRDLFETKRFILKDSPDNARRVLERILHDIATLETLPEAGARVHDSRLKSLGYRYLLVLDGKYIVFYVIYKKIKLVQVRRILSTRQDYLRILNNVPNPSL